MQAAVHIEGRMRASRAEAIVSIVRASGVLSTACLSCPRTTL